MAEEISNQKQLAKAVGTLCATAHSIGEGKSLSQLEASLHVAPGCKAKFLDPAGGLRGWLERHHAADFRLSDGTEVVVELTEAGAAKYGARDMQAASLTEATAETLASAVTDGAARAARAAVFSELAQVAAERAPAALPVEPTAAPTESTAEFIARMEAEDRAAFADAVAEWRSERQAGPPPESSPARTQTFASA